MPCLRKVSWEVDGRLEPWVEWLRRVTKEAETALRKSGATDWVTEHRKRKWSWAGHVARRNDGRWTQAVLDWRPQGQRKQGRPAKRGEDDLQTFFKDVASDMGCNSGEATWRELAQDRDSWKLWGERFEVGG